MEIKEYALQSKLSLKILRWMVVEKIINDPLDEFDLLGLELLEKVWMRRDYLRAQLSQFSLKKRKEFLEKADLKTKWERYAFSRYRNLKEGEKISMKQLINEIEMTFNFELDHWNTKRLYQVREKVYNQRKSEKRRLKPSNK